MNIRRSALITIAVLLLASATVRGQTEDEQTDTSVDDTDTTVEETDTTTDDADSDIQETVQMPVAIDKAAEAGVPDSTLEQMSEAMARGDVDSETVNDAVGTAANEDGPSGITSVGDFVTQNVENGLKGEELSSAIHTHLNEEYGIPAGQDGQNGEDAEDGSETDGPPPVAENYIPEDAQQTDTVLEGQPEVGGELGATDMRSTTRGPAGQAVQPGRPDSAGPPANAGPPARSDAPADAGPPADAGAPAGAGVPANAGAPSNTPASSNAAGPAPDVPAQGPPAGVNPGPGNAPANAGGR